MSSMIPFAHSKRRYERWLRTALRKDFVRKDLAKKHKLMRKSAFTFLRATYWRWAEMSPEMFPDLMGAPSVLAVGDIHLENFGTWRDVEGRLAWGVNDFDEAARMPYTLDLVRLATSAALASSAHGEDIEDICGAIVEGYRDGLAKPRPIVLDRDWEWLRESVVVSDKDRRKFWKKIVSGKDETAPRHFRGALREAMPEPGLPFETARRVAGTGSLGRPRWIAVVKDWRGAPVVREAKAVLSSAWVLTHGRAEEPLRVGEAAAGRYRAPDPWYREAKGIVTRRLSPNNRKIEADTIEARLDGERMLMAMGFELANVHAGADGAEAAIRGDLKSRKAHWLEDASLKAAAVVRTEFKHFHKK